MFRGKNGTKKTTSPFLDTRFQVPAALSNQSQLCGNLPAEFHVDHVNYLGTNHNVSPSLPQNKCRNNLPADAQNFQFSLSNKICRDEADQKANILNQNYVSTGLKLSYDDDKISSFSSASGSMTAASAVFSSLDSDMKREFERQEQELNHLLKMQEDNMMKGLRDITQRHTSSILTVLEQKAAKKLHEKDLELEAINRKNKELVENVNKASSDAQNWCYMAKYNESVVNYLKNNLQQAMESSNRAKEGFGENDTDDATSRMNLASGSHRPNKKDMLCRSCGRKEVCVVLMPCRHLSVCKDCEGFVRACPVCKMITTTSIEVNLS